MGYIKIVNLKGRGFFKKHPLWKVNQRSCTFFFFRRLVLNNYLFAY